MLCSSLPAVLAVSVLVQILVSLAGFAAIFLVIVAIFGQGGEVHRSPQREAAIATGHTDRKTIFEQPFTQPVMWVLLALAHHMALPRLKDWIRRKLVAAGNPNYYTPEEYLAVALMVGVILTLMFETISFLQDRTFGWIPILLGMVFGPILALMQLHMRASNRLRLISRRVPYALDLIALAMGAGATFSEAVRTVVREDVTDEEDPFNVELRAMLAEMELGTTRREAMLNLSQRVPLENLRSIVASVIQAEELGTPLAEVLHAQANLLRLQRSVRAENLAAKASVRILVPSLLILMSVILAVFAPAILRALRGGLF